MTFGIYPGSVSGTDTGIASGKPDNPASIHYSLEELEKGAGTIIIRGYIQYLGEGKLSAEAPENIFQYATKKRKIDLVLCYRSEKYNQHDWTTTIRQLIQRSGGKLDSIQVTEEPNLKGVFAGDGRFEDIEKALHDGVVTAKNEITKLNYKIKVGFNAVPSFNPTDKFWGIIGSEGYHSFREALDYIGLDFFPDVFRRVAEDGQPNDLEESVRNVLGYFRNVNLQAGKIPLTIPIHITENGWSTGEGKSYERQAFVIEKVIRTIQQSKTKLNIARYELFGLRDVDTSNADKFYQFGLLKDDYSAKPAFYIFCKLINELSEK